MKLCWNINLYNLLIWEIVLQCAMKTNIALDMFPKAVTFITFNFWNACNHRSNVASNGGSRNVGEFDLRFYEPWFTNDSS